MSESSLVCKRCNNFAICRDMYGMMIKKTIRHEARDMANIYSHLKRNGFNFPNVRDPKDCWLHNKQGVALFYYSKIKSTAETTSEPRKTAML